MIKQHPRRSNHNPRHLTLPELEQSKTSVLNTLGSMQSRRSYQHAMNEFIAWYCSEPRLALNRIVVLRYRMHLENIPLAPATINLRLAAIRRLAYEASDNGLLSPELVAGIRRVKGVKRLGQQVGNWLTAEEGQQLVGAVRTDTLRGKRDAAMLGLLLGCGLRRSEVANLEIERIQRRDGHWAIVDLVGKAGHVRTVPVPLWVKTSIDSWSCAAGLGEGRLFRAIRKNGVPVGKGRDPECRLVRGEELREACCDRKVGTARFEEKLRSHVPRGRRGDRTDPVSAGPCLSTNDRAVYWVQAEAGSSSE